MTYKELYDRALWDLEHNNITLGEFDRITKPLDREIPKNHGRLIDADALYNDLIFPNELFAKSFKEMLDDAPTIIPAEEFNKPIIDEQTERDCEA